MAAEMKGNPKIAGLTKDIQVEKGKSVYLQTCFVCHQPTGLGVPGQIPPLADSDFLMKNKDDAIRAVVIGRTGETIVNGKTYKGTMIPLAYLTDDQIANVVTYVRNTWGNSGDAVSATDVAKIRAEAATAGPSTTPPASKFE
jgi:nitrite reductase (NO-forming)